MRDPEEAFSLLVVAHSVKDVASALNLDADKFFYAVQNSDGDRYYRRFSIPKKNGERREISQPYKGLALAQDRIAPILSYKYNPGPFVKGFVKGTSFVENARYHQNQRWILNIDIKDFFPSITFARVRGLFLSRHFGFNDRVATILARICTNDGSLPQGASTSPIVANLIAKNLDKKLVELAIKSNTKFTRYSDDITFSSSHKSIPKILISEHQILEDGKKVTLSQELHDAVRNSGFQINPAKTRLMLPNERQEVTGLIVNKKVNIWRKDISRLRMKIYSAEKYGTTEAARVWKKESGADFSNHIVGWLSFIRQVRGKNDPVLSNLCRQCIAAKITQIEWIKEMADMVKQFDVFLSHASEDKDKVRKLKDALEDRGVKVFFDEDSIKWGDSIVEKVNHGLQKSTFFMPFLTKSFSAKGWPNKELNSAIQSNISQKKRILAIREHNFKVEERYPLLADILYKTWPSGKTEEDEFISEACDGIIRLIEDAKAEVEET